MKIKTPMVLDSAYNNQGANWSKMPGLAGMYCKATEGQYTRDVQFASTWKQLRELKIPRAAYHFYRESWYGIPRDPIKQAKFFYDTVMAQGFVQGDRIVLDAEDKSMTIQKILACAREMRRLFNMWPWLYTGFYFMKDNTKGFDKLTDADIDDLKNMGLIISCYPSDPDAFQSIPSQYIPDPKYFGPVIGWQYAGDVKFDVHKLPGLARGYNDDLDFNIFDPNVLALWREGYRYSDTIPPSPPPVDPPLPVPFPVPSATFMLTNSTVENVIGKPTMYHLAAFDLSKFDIVMDGGMNFMTTDKWALKTGVDYAINGLAGWFVAAAKRGRPQVKLDGCAMYHGKGVANFGGLNLYIDQNNKFSLDRPKEIWNAYGFPNLLVKDGIIQPIRKSEYDIRARTAIGVDTRQNYLYVLTVDGGDYWEKTGMNFQQVARIMWQYCNLAVMADGGGSTTAIKNDSGTLRVVGYPSGEETVVVDGKVYHMRPVAVHFGLKRRS